MQFCGTFNPEKKSPTVSIQCFRNATQAPLPRQGPLQKKEECPGIQRARRAGGAECPMVHPPPLCLPGRFMHRWTLPQRERDEHAVPCKDAGNLFMAMEFLQGGSLTTHISRQGPPICRALAVLLDGWRCCLTLLAAKLMRTTFQHFVVLFRVSLQSKRSYRNPQARQALTGRDCLLHGRTGGSRG